MRDPARQEGFANDYSCTGIGVKNDALIETGVAKWQGRIRQIFDESAGSDTQVDHLRRKIVSHSKYLGCCLGSKMDSRAGCAMQIQAITVSLNNPLSRLKHVNESHARLLRIDVKGMEDVKRKLLKLTNETCRSTGYSQMKVKHSHLTRAAHAQIGYRSVKGENFCWQVGRSIPARIISLWKQ